MATVFISGTQGFSASNPSSGDHGRIDGDSASFVQCGDAEVYCGDVERETSGVLKFGTTAVTNAMSIGAGAFAGTITIGGIGSGTTTFPGDLTLTGTSFIAGATTVTFTDNIVLLNDGAGSTGYDSGWLMERSATDFNADPDHLLLSFAMQASNVTDGETSVALSAGASAVDEAYTGALVSIPGVLDTPANNYRGTGQSRTISLYTGATRKADVALWTEQLGTGTVSSDGLSDGLNGTTTKFLTEFQVGDVIWIDSDITPKKVVILTITSDIAMTISPNHSTGGGAPQKTYKWFGPGGNDSATTEGDGIVTIATATHVGLIWDESAHQFVPAATLADPGAGPVVIQDLTGFQSGYFQMQELPQDTSFATGEGSGTETTTDRLPALAADTGTIYVKDVSSIAELFWRDEADNVLQLTSNGVLSAASDLQDGYDGGSDIVLTSIKGPVTISGNNGTSSAVSLLDLNPGILTNANAAVDITWQSGAYTQAMTGIEIDYSAALHGGGAFDAVALDLIGPTVSVPTIFSEGIHLDENFSEGAIAIGDTPTAFTNITNEGLDASEWFFTTASNAVSNTEGMRINIAPGIGGVASSTAGGDGGSVIINSAQGGASSTGGGETAGAAGIIDLDAGQGGDGVGGSGSGALGGAATIDAGDGAAAVTGFNGAVGGVIRINYNGATGSGGIGGSSATAAVNAANGGAVTISSGDGGDSSNTGNGGAGANLAVNSGDGGSSVAGSGGSGGLFLFQGGDGAGAGAGANASLTSGVGDTTGNSGDVLIDPGSITGGTRGDILFGSLQQGYEVELNAGSTGFEVNSAGQVTFDTGDNAIDGTDTSDISLTTGNQTSTGGGINPSGAITLSTAATTSTTAASESGNITFTTGDVDASAATASNSGAITLSTGTAGSSGTVGNIFLDPGGDSTAERSDITIGTSGNASQAHLVMYADVTGSSVGDGDTGDGAPEIILQNNDGDFFALWVDNDGVIRLESIGASLPADGVAGKSTDRPTSTIVGLQST